MDGSEVKNPIAVCRQRPVAQPRIPSRFWPLISGCVDCYGLAFLLHLAAAEKNEAESEQAEHEGVFFGFGNGSVADGQAQSMAGKIRVDDD